MQMEYFILVVVKSWLLRGKNMAHVSNLKTFLSGDLKVSTALSNFIKCWHQSLGRLFNLVYLLFKKTFADLNHNLF